MTNQPTLLNLDEGFISMVRTEENTLKYDNLNPTHIGTVGGIRFHEHPTRGDESALIVRTTKRWVITSFWDMPTLEDLGIL